MWRAFRIWLCRRSIRLAEAEIEYSREELAYHADRVTALQMSLRLRRLNLLALERGVLGGGVHARVHLHKH